MKHIRLIALVVVGVALLGGAMVYKQQRNAGKADEYKTNAVEMIKLADAYKADPPYITGLMEAGFAPAAKAGAGGLFSGFDEERYFTALFQSMVDQAKKDGKPEVAKLLRNFAVGRKFLGVKDN